MPVKVKELKKLLHDSAYRLDESQYLLEGFSKGFDLQYQGPREKKDHSASIPFKEGLGSHEELWEKMLKEVGERRFAGPFDDIPFEHFVQSPIGLVPKGNGQQTRLIFHLSYNFKGSYGSINSYIPEHLCSNTGIWIMH